MQDPTKFAQIRGSRESVNFVAEVMKSRQEPEGRLHSRSRAVVPRPADSASGHGPGMTTTSRIANFRSFRMRLGDVAFIMSP